MRSSSSQLCEDNMNKNFLPISIINENSLTILLQRLISSIYILHLRRLPLFNYGEERRRWWWREERQKTETETKVIHHKLPTFHFSHNQLGNCLHPSSPTLTYSSLLSPDNILDILDILCMLENREIGEMRNVRGAREVGEYVYHTWQFPL